MTYSIDIINLVISKLINKQKIIKISEAVNISITTINKWKYLYKDNIQNKTYIKSNISTNIHGLNKKNKYIDTIKNYINNNEGSSLDKIVKEVTNNELSKSTVCRLLKENNISRKRIQSRIVCKDINKIKEDRTNFANNSDNNNFNEYISIDESSFCITDLQQYGYSKKGQEIKRMIKHKHNKERYSLLLAISKSEIVAYKIYNGSLDAESYKNFIDTNKEKFINKTIIQDNVRLHHSKIVKEYTPEFNPIEQVFNQTKTEFRKYDHTNMIDDIEKSLLVVKPNHLNNYFNNTIKIINSYKTI